MHIIGLTGSIASGKSTVSTLLKQRGFPVVDADQVARDVVQVGSASLAEIERAFGRGALLPDGSLNRQQLADLIFHDPGKRVLLNSILHPAIRREMARRVEELERKGAPVAFLDIPLLFESKLEGMVDRVITVTVTEAIQLQRLMERSGLSREEANARISSQLPLSVKELRADAVIYNSGTVEQTAHQLDRLLENWQLTL